MAEEKCCTAYQLLPKGLEAYLEDTALYLADTTIKIIPYIPEVNDICCWTLLWKLTGDLCVKSR